MAGGNAMKEYRGIIVAEDLNNEELLKEIDVNNVRVIQSVRDKMTWHVLDVSVNREQIDELSRSLKENRYMHFWKNKNVIAIFAGPKYFEFNYEDKSTWKSVLKYTDFLEIPRNKVDFSITGL